MAKKKRSGPGGVPWSVVAAGLHIASDFALKAACPRYGGQVILYYCKDCNRPVWPKRRNPFGS
jgi:hypothetical protein